MSLKEIFQSVSEYFTRERMDYAVIGQEKYYEEIIRGRRQIS